MRTLAFPSLHTQRLGYSRKSPVAISIAYLLRDFFKGDTGVTLTGHAPEVGNVWTTTTFITDDNYHAKLDENTLTPTLAYTDIGVSNAYLNLICKSKGNANAELGMFVRYTDANNYIRIWKTQSGGGVFAIEKVVGGVVTTLASILHSPANNPVDWMRFYINVTLSGPNITARFIYGNGTSNITLNATDAFNQTATKVGILAANLAAPAGNISQFNMIDASLDSQSLGYYPYINIVYEGDSLTFPADFAWAHSWVSQLVETTRKPPTYLHDNIGIQSRTLAQATASTVTGNRQVLSSYNPTMTKNILSVWLGSNDLATIDAATLETNYLAYCSTRRAEGWKIVAFTILPRSAAGTIATFEANRQLFNAWLRINWPSFADALADVAANNTIGDSGDELNTTYYLDLVHLTDAGHAIVAGIVDLALATIV
jgi:hypothetical protein